MDWRAVLAHRAQSEPETVFPVNVALKRLVNPADFELELRTTLPLDTEILGVYIYLHDGSSIGWPASPHQQVGLGTPLQTLVRDYGFVYAQDSSDPEKIKSVLIDQFEQGLIKIYGITLLSKAPELLRLWDASSVIDRITPKDVGPNVEPPKEPASEP